MIDIRKAANLAARIVWLWRNRPYFSDTPGEKPRLLVDVSTIIRHDSRTGIQRVVRAIWSELLRRSGKQFEAVPVYATAKSGYCYAPFDFLERAPGALKSEPVQVRPGDKFLGLDLAAHLLPNYRRQLQAWRANGATIHLVVYDMLPVIRPDWFSAAAVRCFRKWLKVLSQEVDQAVCISATVSEDLRQQLQRSGTGRNLEIGRLRLGGDISASVPSTGIDEQESRLLRQLSSRPMVLMVSTIEPRKGYEVALAAFDHLWQTAPAEAPDLIIVGKRGWKTEALQARLRSHPQLGKRMHWLENTSDEALSQFYDHCRGVLVTSRAEGFGLPLAEAATHRKWILVRDLPVFREQRLPNVLYFADDRPAALGEQVLELIQIAAQGEPPLAVVPTWTECVEDMLAEIGVRDPGPCTRSDRLQKAELG